MKKLSIVIALVGILFSCESGPQKKILKEANGRINNVLKVSGIVINESACSTFAV